MVTRKTGLLLVGMLWLVVIVCNRQLIAEDKVELPNVTFQEASPKQFQLNKRFQLMFQSDVAPSHLRARLFPGSIKELKAKIQSSPKGTCVRYGSWVFNYAGADGGVEFNLFWNPSWLARASDEGFDNMVYTVVLEKNEGPAFTYFRLYPDEADQYFDHGLEIVVVAPGYLKSGAKAKEEIAKLKPQPAIGGSLPTESANGFSSTAGSSNTPKGMLESCIVIHSKPMANADSRSTASNDQLAEVPCLALGLPELVHWPSQGLGLHLGLAR